MDSQVQILQVTVRNTKSGRAVYDVACGDGVTRQVWEAGTANALNALQGQTIWIREKVEVKGQYTNRTILAFAQPGTALPPDPGGGQLAPVGGLAAPLVGGAVQPIQASPQGGGGGGRGYPPEVTTRITKLASLEYAATLVGGILAGSGPEAFEQAVEMTLTAAKTFYGVARSHENVGAPAAASDPALAAAQALIDAAAQSGALTTPQAVAQVVPGVQVGAPVEQPAAVVAAAQDASAESPDVIQWD